ncbi:TonB-dependent receptor [Nitrincola lacisaponensis]|uniref:TonB-dependent receptor n=1 Tax=Nitrincola lacisaponensis TaxID=267850 RepID=A0A063Y5G9_9GAMM|nr:FepA family TonB-dependent siderophore receptor [Nitrincola lacisaponensis]KDE39772.1 TonB-dependent receptor [Nitrincola lacisaponensis]
MKAKRTLYTKPLLLSMHLALLSGSIFFISHAPKAEAQQQAQTINIPAGTLIDALTKFALEQNVYLIGSTELAEGLSSNGLSGYHTVESGFKQLLANTGLEIVPLTDKGYGLRAVQTTQMDEQVRLADLFVTATAEQMLRQSPGVSIIRRTDLEKTPVTNDLSEIVRRMPGVNLTGNSSTGQFGNSRQIDLRGMGPENTMILIDGVPVSSRNSTRMGRSGERNTRGDSNWVPAEMVERIEVIRGPAAARYGSGASGGVVNIITTAPSQTTQSQITYYTNRPENDNEQITNRVGYNVSGPVSESVSYRFYGSYNKTDADSLDLNEAFATGVTPPAGREGVVNENANLRLRWDINPSNIVEFNSGVSRQGNIYAGDRAMNAGYEGINNLAEEGTETNRIYRYTGSLSHRGIWEGGRTSRVSLAYEETNNRRLREGLSGGSEGAFLRDPDNTAAATNEMSTSILKNWFMNGEFNTPLHHDSVDQMLTLGYEVRYDSLDDPYSLSNSSADLGLDENRNSVADATSIAVFIENNMQLTDQLAITPGLRIDHHSQFGYNLSPSLNLFFDFAPNWSIKGGIARAFKAPNLYQSNTNYFWETRGNGCPVNWPRPNNSGCLIQGNSDLNPEISINKEVGLFFDDQNVSAGITYFRNDYDNKVVADMPDLTPELLPSGRYLFQWSNSDKAIVQGIEGHLTIPLLGRHDHRLKLSNNFTYMIENHNKTTDQPLSVIPEYTINSSLDWQANEQLNLVLTATFYGEQEPRTRNINGADTTGDALSVRKPYHIFGASAEYRFNEHIRGRVGVSNLLNKQLYREHNQNGAGAATYNEAGRSYFASLTASF